MAVQARLVSWQVLVGAGAGSLAGLLVGGLGGRLAMLVLRLTSPDDVLGVTSDDGFEIGVVSADTGNLLFATAVFGALNGIAYVAVRSWLPARLRMPLWALLAAALVGAAVIHPDGVDFTLLDPLPLAVALFVLLPGVAAALVVVLVERWIGRGWEHRRLAAVLALAACIAAPALAAAALVAALWLGATRIPWPGATLRVARVATPAAIALIAVAAAVGLVRDLSAIL